MLTHDVHSSRCDCFDSVIETYPIPSFLTVMSELYQKGLITEDDLCPPHILRYSLRDCLGRSSRHWLDSLVRTQSFKLADVRARTLDILRRYLLTEVGKETQTKHTGETIHYFHLYLCICMYNQCHV